MKLFKRRAKQYTSEIHQYVVDIDEVNTLRSHSDKTEEVVRYNTMIKVMQEIVIRLGGKVR